MPNLNDIDAKILKFLRNRKSGCSTIPEAEQNFPDVSAVKLRMELLADLNYIRQDIEQVKDGALTRTVLLETYRITDYGRKELQNYEHSTRKDRRELWLKNAWIPIIVAFVTSILTHYILPTLPVLIEWFHRILSRIA